MAETSPSRSRTLAAIPLAAALAGCAATHVGDDWQCPLAQGEICTSIAAADPAVAPAAAPPPLATRTPLYRAPEAQAAVQDSESGTNSDTATQPDTNPRPCAEGCHPLAWLGRLFAARDAVAEAAEHTDEASATQAVTPASAATDRADEAPCGAGQSAPKPPAAQVDADDGAGDDGAPCAIAAEAQETAMPAPIVPSTAAAIPCDPADAPVMRPVEAESTKDAHVSEGAQGLCAAPGSVEEPTAAESTEPAEAGVAAAAVDSMAPTSAPRLPPPPAPDALRTGEVVGRIWIAPFVDAGGVYREGAWVRAVLAHAEWRRR